MRQKGILLASELRQMSRELIETLAKIAGSNRTIDADDRNGA